MGGYRGVLHEFMHCPQDHTAGHLPWRMRRNHDGARRRIPQTYAKDAEVFVRALETEQDPFLRSRYTFYLAQSYRDCQQYPQAIAHCLQRSVMGGWQEEVYYSLYEVSRLKERLALQDDEVLAAYETATQVMPSRIEALTMPFVCVGAKGATSRATRLPSGAWAYLTHQTRCSGDHGCTRRACSTNMRSTLIGPGITQNVWMPVCRSSPRANWQAPNFSGL